MTLSSADCDEEPQAPGETFTAAHSASHAEMDQRIQKGYQSIQKIPITYQEVCILYSGHGGCTKGVELCNREYGTSFTVVCVVDVDKRMLELHTRNFPSIPTCLCKTGYSYTTTMDKISLVYPRQRWHESVFLASVECELGSTANNHQRTLAQFAKKNMFAVRLLKRIKPKAQKVLWRTSGPLAAPRTITRDLRNFLRRS